MPILIQRGYVNDRVLKVAYVLFSIPEILGYSKNSFRSHSIDLLYLSRIFIYLFVLFSKFKKSLQVLYILKEFLRIIYILINLQFVINCKEASYETTDISYMRIIRN